MTNRRSRLRVAIIGAGAIAEFHAPALREAGFELGGVCSRPGSASVADFAVRHGIPQVFDGAERLLAEAGAWDALVVTAPTGRIVELLELALTLDVPVLVEKPVALRSEPLVPFLGRDLPVLVGYNRRFYRTAAVVHEEVVSGPPVLATLTLPETLEGAVGEEPFEAFFTNSVHGLDLALWVFGPLEVEQAKRVTADDGGVVAIAALLRSARGDVVQFIGNWGAPANFALTVDRPGRRLDLRPFEAMTIYEGMEVVEPSPETPIRSYRPQVSGTVALDEVDLRFKPGFVAQARALGALCHGASPAPGARLEDAHAVLVLAEKLAGI